ncbi:MAG: Vms1/Ankzf1 family peptidyl-tRNA hydrolase [Litorilinea sp.]
MSIDGEIRQAIEFESDNANPVLSVYLNIAPQRGSSDKFRLALRNLLDQAAEGELQADPEDIRRMQNFMEMGYIPQGRSLILFSCAARDFWWAKSYMVPVEDSVFVSRRPNVRQLAALLDTYARYGVIHVDQEGVRLYLFSMGNLEAVDGHLGEEVKQHKAGGWAAARIQRHESGVARHNLQDAAEMAEDFYRRSDTQQLILAGTEKNVARFREMLSHRLRAMVLGRVAATANATPSQISEKALALAQQAGAEHAQAITDRIVTAVHKQDAAVAGLAQVLTAVQEGRALHVAVLSDFAQSAYRFVDSGYILLELTDQSELGSGRIQELPDAVESVLRRALAQGIGVTILDEHAGLEKLGKIAALTRY